MIAKIKEGMIKKGGRNDSPSCPRPSKPPKGMDVNRRAFLKHAPLMIAGLSFGLLFSGALGNKEKEDAYLKRWQDYCKKNYLGVLEGEAYLTKDFMEGMMRFIHKEIK